MTGKEAAGKLSRAESSCGSGRDNCVSVRQAFSGESGGASLEHALDWRESGLFECRVWLRAPRGEPWREVRQGRPSITSFKKYYCKITTKRGCGS